MLRSQNSIRLTDAEVKHLTLITGFVPVVKTEEELRNYIQRCKNFYAGGGNDTLILWKKFDQTAAAIAR